MWQLTIENDCHRMHYLMYAKTQPESLEALADQVYDYGCTMCVYGREDFMQPGLVAFYMEQPERHAKVTLALHRAFKALVAVEGCDERADAALEAVHTAIKLVCPDPDEYDAATRPEVATNDQPRMIGVTIAHRDEYFIGCAVMSDGTLVEPSNAPAHRDHVLAVEDALRIRWTDNGPRAVVDADAPVGR